MSPVGGGAGAAAGLGMSALVHTVLHSLASASPCGSMPPAAPTTWKSPCVRSRHCFFPSKLTGHWPERRHCSRHTLTLTWNSNFSKLTAAGAGGVPKRSRCVQSRWAAAKTCRQASQLWRCPSTSTSRWARTPRAGTRCTAGPMGRPAGRHMRPQPARPPRPSRTAPVRRSWSLGSRGCLLPVWFSMLPTTHSWHAHAEGKVGRATHMPSTPLRGCW